MTLYSSNSDKSEMGKEQIYDEQINPLMKEIIEICKANGIPFLASFQLASAEEDFFCSSGLFPEGCSENLTNARDALLAKKSFFTSIISRSQEN